MTTKRYWRTLTDEQKRRIGSVYRAYGAIKTLDYLEQQGIQVSRFTAMAWAKRIGARIPGMPAVNPRAPRWTDEDIEQLREFYPNAAIPPMVLTEIFGRTYSSIAIKARELGIERSTKRELFTKREPSIDPGKILLLSDLHAPHIDHRWLERVTTVARAWNCRAVLVVGDAIHPAVPVENIRRHWRNVEARLSKQFREVYWLTGGLTHHKSRILSHIIRDFDVIGRPDRVHPLAWYRVSIGDWVIAHEQSPPREYVATSRSNLVTTWTHHNSQYWQQGYRGGLPRQIVELGPCCKIGTRCHRIQRSHRVSGQLGAALMWKHNGQYDIVLLHGESDFDAIARMRPGNGEDQREEAESVDISSSGV